jgi:hypothetical protein
LRDGLGGLRSGGLIVRGEVLDGLNENGQTKSVIQYT